MEKMNDTMTICTLARPDVIPVKVESYKHLCRVQEHYDILVNAICHAITLDDDKPTIDYNGKAFLVNAFCMLEPSAFYERIDQLKGETES